MGLMEFASCSDKNEWSVDPSVTKQRPPTSLSVEVKDSATLDISVQIGEVASAASYELQVSESPMTPNDAIPVEGEIYTFSGITADQFDNGKYIITRVNDKFTIEENTTYYFRVRAYGQDGTVSNWYTNGMLYYGGISNPTTAKKMLENTYCMTETPAVMWIGDADVESDQLTINWHETDYATLKYLRNENTGEKKDITGATQDPTYTKTKVWKYEWTGLEVDTEYTFSLLDESDNVIASIMKATEPAPDETISFFIGSFPAFVKTDADFTLNSTDASGNESTLFKGTFKIGGQMKTEAKTNSDNPYVYPFDKSVFLPLSPGLNTKDTSKKYNRISSGGSSSSIELDIPAPGRLYLYIACEKGVVKLTQGSEEEGTLKEVTLKSPLKIAKPSTPFTKGYVEKGKATITWTASTYICGIHFVPWEAVTE